MLLTPLVLWLWIGGAVMAVGTLLAAFPAGAGAARPIRCRRPSTCPRGTAKDDATRS